MATGLSTFNKFFVGMQAGRDDVITLKPIPQRLTRDDAIILAAHLVAVADLDGSRFREYLDELLET